MERKPDQFVIVKIEPYVGSDTYLTCGTIDVDGESNEQSIFLVVHTGHGTVVDAGYRTFAEAKEAWPDSVNPRDAVTP